MPEDDETEVLHIAPIQSEKSEEINKDVLSTNEKNKKKKKKKKSSESKKKKKRKRHLSTSSSNVSNSFIDVLCIDYRVNKMLHSHVLPYSYQCKGSKNCFSTGINHSGYIVKTIKQQIFKTLKRRILTDLGPVLQS